MRLVFLMALVALSCKQEITSRTAPIFNIDSLVNHQIDLLANGNSGLEKISSIDGKKNESVFLLKKTVDWKSELEPFQAIGTINKSIYKDRYKFAVIPDEKSNLKIRAWTSIQDSGDVPVSSLKVYYLEGPYRVKKIEAVLTQRNFLFESVKKLNLDFTVLGGNNSLNRYQITGTQKFLWEDSHSFSLDGIIPVK